MSARVLTPSHWVPTGEAALRLPDNREVFVREGIVGEAALVLPAHAGAHRVIGRLVRPAGAPHPSRRRPPCRRFRPCGGCPFMHMVPEAQAAARLALVADALRGVGLEALAPRALIAGPDGDTDYRHVARLAVGWSERGEVRLGAFGRGTHDVVPIPECTVSTPVIREMMTKVAHAVRDADIHPYNPETGQGTLRTIVLRQSRANGQVLVTIVAGRSNPALGRLAERIAVENGAVAGVWLHLNDSPGNAIFAAGSPDGPPPFTRLAGRDTIEDTLDGVRLRVGPGDFFQANPGVAGRIAQDLVALAAEDRARPVVDLYAGVGGFTLALGRHHGLALGAEVVPGAVLRAEENARLNHIAARFVRGTVLDALPEIARRLGGHPPVVLVDPARRGLEAGVLDGILSLSPARVLYVSCNPRALARDLAAFARAGWRVDALHAYDMFPQTSHVEVLARLSPPAPAPAAGVGPRRRIVRDQVD
jgi:23S rRNA (uracil1939-C5)-methyltransferase